MITAYHVAYSRSTRPIWLMEELGIPHTVKKVSMSKGDLQTPEFLALNPMGTVPVVTDGDVALTESGSCLQYLMERYGAGEIVPAVDSDGYATYLNWFHFGEATATTPVTDIVQNTRLKPEELRIPEQVKWATMRLQRTFGMMDQQLADHEFITGDKFTAADIMVTYPLILGSTMNLQDGFPNCAAYLDRMMARPALAKTMAY